MPVWYSEVCHGLIVTASTECGKIVFWVCWGTPSHNTFQPPPPPPMAEVPPDRLSRGLADIGDPLFTLVYSPHLHVSRGRYTSRVHAGGHSCLMVCLHCPRQRPIKMARTNFVAVFILHRDRHQHTLSSVNAPLGWTKMGKGTVLYWPQLSERTTWNGFKVHRNIISWCVYTDRDWDLYQDRHRDWLKWVA